MLMTCGTYTTIKMRLFFRLLLLFCKVLTVCGIRPPQIDGEDKMLVEEGNPITLRCQGSKPLQWYKNVPDFENFTKIKNKTQDDTSFPFVSTLSLPESIIDDNGYYYCHYNDTTDLENDKESVDSIYVFVTGEDPFVNHWLRKLKLLISHNLQINCTVTDPGIRVTLKKNEINITNEERVKFDPKKGFLIENVTMDDEGSYLCEAKGVELQQVVEIISKRRLPSPSIHKGKNQHFVKGEGFSLECIIVDDQNITFSWSYPNKGVKHAETYEFKQFKHVSTLHVSKASKADTGPYTCLISAESAISDKVSMDITVEDNLTSYVKINSSKEIEAIEGQPEPAKWKTTVLSYPASPRIEYTNWRGQVLKQTDKIIIEFNGFEGLSWLRIKNISSSDFGNYTITVTTVDNADEKSATALFEVQSAPHLMVKDVPQFVTKEKKVKVMCRAEGFPTVNVSLLFQNCSSTLASSCNSLGPIQTMLEEMNFPAPGNIVEKSISFSPKTSGLLWCLGENDHGPQNKSAVIRISDIDGIFVLRHSGQDEITEVNEKDHGKSVIVVVNDNFSLMCGGSKFEYKSIELVSSLQSGSSIQFHKDDSEFSWQTKKIVTKATKTLAGNFTCTAQPHDHKKTLVKSMIITVVDEEPVRFEKEANMTNTSVTVKDDESLSLKCIVTGSPTPTIQWLKDKKILTNKSEFFDRKVMHFITDMELKFDYVSKKHMGVYTCIAKNRLNEVIGSLIIEKPDWRLAANLGLAIAFTGVVFLIIVVGFLVNRVKKEQQIKKSFKQLSRSLFEKGNIDSLNPTSTADKQADMLPYDKTKWEVPQGNITIGKQLGTGAFGRVIKASVTGLDGPAAKTVAVKMCKNDVDTSQMHALIAELKIMMHLGKHLNIVNLMGASTVQISAGELWILVEYCRFGNLLDFMLKHRRKFRNQICPVTGKINRQLVPNSPMSSILSETYSPSPAVDEDGYLDPSVPEFVLSDPPAGHFAGTVPSSAMLTPSSRSSIPHGSPGQLVSNPMYSMKIDAATENPNKESEGNENSKNSKILQRKGSRFLSIGSNFLSDGSSVSHPLRSPDTLQQSSFHFPLSPTDTYFIGETDSDFILDIGSVPGVTAPFCTTDLICWGWQMAQGMNYLSRRKILHGDLAARNLLLADNNVVKISDFGLSRNMYRNDNYVKKGDDLLPIKWMSIEAIRDRIFSIESDVWAYGITLWEIFCLGSTPYAGMEINNDLVEKLDNGYRMSCPKYGTEEIYKIMKQCWEADPLERPSFHQLVDDLGQMISDLTEGYLAQNETYMQMNRERFKDETDYLSMMANPNFESKTMPDEVDVGQYVNMKDSIRNSSIRVEFADTVAYSAAGGPPLSPVGSTYLHMGSVQSQSPSENVFSPHPSESLRFTFSSSNPESSRLTSLPEEEKSTPLKPEEPSENTAFLV